MFAPYVYTKFSAHARLIGYTSILFPESSFPCPAVTGKEDFGNEIGYTCACAACLHAIRSASTCFSFGFNYSTQLGGPKFKHNMIHRGMLLVWIEFITKFSFTFLCMQSRRTTSNSSRSFFIHIRSV